MSHTIELTRIHLADMEVSRRDIARLHSYLSKLMDDNAELKAENRILKARLEAALKENL